MREFLLIARKAPTGASFSVRNKTESSLVCRTLTAALWVSKGIRANVIAHVALLGPPSAPLILSVDSNTIENFPFDEKGVAKIIREALLKASDLKKDQTIQPTPGLTITKQSVEQFIKTKALTSTIVYLHKKGKDIRSIKEPENLLFIFGDLFGIPKNQEKYLDRYAQKCSLGKVMLFASYCPVLVHYELDRLLCEK